MNQIDLAFSSALTQAQLISNQEVSPLELVELYLQRIEQLDSQLGSYFTVMADSATSDARAKTELLANNSSPLPPFFGVPIAIKDLNPVAGVRCTYGTPVLIDNIATYDDGVVTRLKQAGFIILGKTATSELGSFPYTEPLGFPPTRNPWNLDYTAGGSSGGSAAAVAAGLCAVAIGSDGGGSVRGPAFCCGLVGIKPSRGRISYAPVGDLLSGIPAIGSLTRTVADGAAMLDVMAGYVTGDPYWLPSPETSFLSAVSQTPKPLTIAFSTSIPPLGEVETQCKQAVLDTVKVLASLGHHVEEKCPDFTGLTEPFTAVWQAGVAYSGLSKEVLQPMNQWLYEQTASAGDYLRAVSQMQIIARKIVAFFDTVDVLVLPTYTHPTIKVGEWANLSPQETFERIVNWVAPCPPFNATGQSAIALPTGFDFGGLPLGVQLIGRPAAEATILSLAAQLENANIERQNRPNFAV